MRKFNPTTPLRNMTEVIQAVQFRGSHFFDRDTMRAFNSRLADDVYVTKFGTFIITSEKDRPFTYSDGRPSPGAWNHNRRYTVRFVACRKIRHISWADHVYTADRGEFADVFPDDFGAFGSLKAARKAAHEEKKRLDALLIKDNPVLFDTRQADIPDNCERTDYKSDIQFGPWPLAEMPADATDREFWTLVDGNK
jgi:hypothetical protein